MSSADYSAVLLWPSGAELARRLPRLLGGIVALGVGIALTLDARLGVSPWDVLHQGVARRTGLTFGTVVVLTGVVVLALWIPLGQRMGIGTVVNTLSVGYLVDLTLYLEPEPTVLVWRWAYLLGGFVIAAIGMAAFIGAGLGPG
ncbi:MAG: YczE/YyaS/YitT family protein, partial [Acidimicrobiia bacterium]